MGAYRFIANRTVEGPGGRAGRVRMAVKAGSDTAEGQYECPSCGKGGKISQPFRRPIQVRCAGCQFLMKLSRLKKEGKKKA